MRRSRSKIATLTASVIAASAAMFVPAQTAQAAQSATLSNGAQFSTSIVYDGTGFGTRSACFINSKNGFPVGDNTANDGNVCSGDSVSYRLSYSFPSTTTATSYTIKVPQFGAMYADSNTLTWCASDTITNKWTAVRTNSSTCVLTVAPNQSISGFFDNVLQVQPPSATTPNVFSPVFSVAVEKEAATNIPTDPVTILTTPTGDAFGALKSPNPTSVTVNGVAYLRYTYHMASLTYLYTGYDYNKGYLGSTSSEKIVVDMSALPPGTLIQNPSTDVTINGTTATYDTKSAAKFKNNWTGSTFTYQSGTGQYNYGSVDILIPRPASVSSWDIRITEATTTAVNTNVYYKTSQYAVEDGMTTPKTTATANRGITYLNNDYTLVSYNPIPDAGKLVSKTVYTAKTDGSNSGIVASGSGVVYRPDNQFWSTISVASYPTSLRDLTVCDSFFTGMGTSSTGPQDYDTSRNIRVYTFDDAGTKTEVTSGFTVSYGTVASSGTPSCSSSSATWSSTPSQDSNIVKVNFGPTDMASGYGLKYVVDVPVKAAPRSDYGTYPNSVAVSDTATVSLVNSDGSNGTGVATVNYSVGGPRITGNTNNEIVNNATDTGGSIGPGSVVAGSTDYFNTSNSLTPNGYVVGDDPVIKLSEAITLSSCALSVSPTALNLGSTTGMTYAVTKPNLGADGIACTADDVSGWTIVGTGTIDITGGLTAGRFQGTSVKFTVAPWDSSTQVTGTSTLTYSTSFMSSTTAVVSDTVQISAQATAGQYKQVDYDRRMAGSDIGWTLNMFNSNSVSALGSEFIDILPYNGDANGSVLASPLSNIRIDTTNLPSDAKVYVTTDAPAMISSVVTDASNDPSNSARWCVYGSSSCPSGGNYTAVYVNAPTIDIGKVFNVHVTAGTSGTKNNDKAINAMGTGYVASSAVPVFPSSKVVTVLYRNTVSGNIYGDLNLNGKKDTGETNVGSYGVSLLDATGNVIATTKTDASGNYTFNDLADGTFSVRIDDPDKVSYSGVTQDWTLTGASATTTSPQFTLNDNSQTKVDFGLSGVNKATLSKTVDKNTAIPGDVLKYTMTFTNTGTTQLTTVNFTDTNCTGLTNWSGDTGSDGIMNPGEVWTRTCTYTVLSSDVGSVYTNKATVIANDSDPATPGINTGASVSTNIVAAPSIQITKTGAYSMNNQPITEGAVLLSGTPVRFSYSVKNTGGLAVTSYTVVDDKMGTICTVQNLGPGATSSCSKVGTVS